MSVAYKVLDIIRQWKDGKITKLNISTGLIRSALDKKGSAEVINELTELITNHLKHLLEMCQGCPSQCIHGLDDKCHMFDSGPY